MQPSTQAFAGLVCLFGVAVLIGVCMKPGTVEPGQPVRSTGMLVDVNSADAATLQLLPGVGPGIAEHIIEARESGAVFRSAEDLEQVRFVGPSVVGRVRPWISFSSETTTLSAPTVNE